MDCRSPWLLRPKNRLAGVEVAKEANGGGGLLVVEQGTPQDGGGEGIAGSGGLAGLPHANPQGEGRLEGARGISRGGHAIPWSAACDAEEVRVTGLAVFGLVELL